MAYQLIWSPTSRDDLHDLVRYIAKDSPERAEAFALRLMTYADMLQQNPEIGRVVIEWSDPTIREIIFRPYRIVYRVNKEREVVEIARVWHGARGTPTIPE